jgi:hypothetical protein
MAKIIERLRGQKPKREKQLLKYYQRGTAFALNTKILKLIEVVK